MDKRTDVISFRLPPALKQKLSKRAQKNLRNITDQLIYDISLAEHIQDFDPEKDITINFFEMSVNNVGKD